MLDALLRDVRYALRWLRRSPGFAAIAVASFAIGIGVNTALFSLVDAMLFRPLPVRDPGTLVDVFASSNHDRYSTFSYPDFVDVKAQNKVFDDMLGFSPMFAALNLGDRSRLISGEIVTGNYFRMLGVNAAVGRRSSPPTTGSTHRVWSSSPTASGAGTWAPIHTSSAASCACAASRTRSSA